MCKSFGREVLSGFDSLMNIPVFVPAGSVAYHVDFSSFLSSSVLVVVRCDAAVQVALGSSSGALIPIDLVDGRYGYFVASTDGLTGALYVWAASDANLDLVLIGA